MFKKIKDKKEKKKDKKSEEIVPLTPTRSDSDDRPVTAQRKLSSQESDVNNNSATIDVEEYFGEGLTFEVNELGEKRVKGGRIEKLVEYLTSVYCDPQFLRTFMLTFRSFTTPEALLDLLTARFSAEFDEKMQRIVQLRIINFTKTWITNRFYDFEESPELLQKLENIINNVMTPSINIAANLLKSIAKQKDAESEKKNVGIIFSEKPPVPHIPMNITTKEQSNSILTYHPEELARQLTLIDYNIYKKIKPHEYLNQGWARKNKEVLSPNLLTMIRRFNEVSGWIASEILQSKSLANRVKVLQHIIEIAEYCKNLNNLNSAMEIISGLNSSSIFRLKQTWSSISKNHLKSFEEMKELLSSNKSYTNLRQYFRNLNPPCIPYLGLYLTDLTFIDEGIPSQSADIINFSKQMKVAQAITDIQVYQTTPYCLEEVPFIRDYLLNVEIFPEEQCYRLSLKREARGGATNTTEEDEEDEPFGEMEKIDGYPFDEPDTDASIIFEKSHSPEQISYIPVNYATLPKLIERLTYHKYQDTDSVFASLMTLNTFTDPQEFFHLLEVRFNMPKPKNPSKQQLSLFTTTRLIPIRFRIVNIVKIWVNSYIEDFMNTSDSAFISHFKAVLDDWSSDIKLTGAIESIKTLYSKKVSEPVTKIQNVFVGLSTPLNYSEDKKSDILKFSIDDLAQSLCFIDQSIFLNIKPRECLFVQSDSQMKESAPNIYDLKINYENTKAWATSEYLKQTDNDARVKVLSLLILVSEKLYNLNNYNSAFAIIEGINSIQNELEASLIWISVPRTVLNIYREMDKYLKSPESSVSLKNSPSIPHLRTYIDQLVQLHNKPDTVNQLINFQKRREQYEIVRTWNSLNQESYSFEKNSSCLNYLQSVHLFTSNEIRKRAESLERASDVKKLDGLRRLDSNSENYDFMDSPRDKEKDEQLKVIRSSILTLAKEDKNLMEDVISQAKKELQNDLLIELKSYMDFVRDEIALSKQQLGLTNNADVASERIILRLYPGSLVIPITEIDSEKQVFEWEEEFTIYQVDDSDSKLLIHITPKLEKSDLSTAFKIFSFFKSKLANDNRRSIILTSKCNDDAKNIAQRFGISVETFLI